MEESQCEHHKIEGKNPPKKNKIKSGLHSYFHGKLNVQIVHNEFSSLGCYGSLPLNHKEQGERERVYTYEFQAMGQIEDSVVYQSVRFDSLEVDPTLFFFSFFQYVSSSFLNLQFFNYLTCQTLERAPHQKCQQLLLLLSFFSDKIWLTFHVMCGGRYIMMYNVGPMLTLFWFCPNFCFLVNFLLHFQNIKKV